MSATILAHLLFHQKKSQMVDKQLLSLHLYEHAQKIQPGDTLKVNWTSSGTVFGVGFKKTIPLSIDGTYVGDMVITDGSATVTFQ